MKMPDSIGNEMFAPCGMNCMVCYKHCYHKKPCAGCLNSDKGKPEHCRKCSIKSCAVEKGRSYCYECPDFPCRQIQSLEKSYMTRYSTSLLANSETVKTAGIEAFMKLRRERFTCPACGGVISVHDAECSECHEKYDRARFK